MFFFHPALTVPKFTVGTGAGIFSHVQVQLSAGSLVGNSAVTLFGVPTGQGKLEEVKEFEW